MTNMELSAWIKERIKESEENKETQSANRRYWTGQIDAFTRVLKQLERDTPKPVPAPKPEAKQKNGSRKPHKWAYSTVAINLKTRVKRRLKSMSDVCVVLGIPSNVIADVIKGDVKYTAKYGYALAREEEEYLLTQELLDEGLAEYEKQKHDRIVVQDIITGQKHEFEFAADAAEFVGKATVGIDVARYGTCPIGIRRGNYLISCPDK